MLNKMVIRATINIIQSSTEVLKTLHHLSKNLKKGLKMIKTKLGILIISATAWLAN